MSIVKLKLLFPHLVALFIFFVVNAIFFAPQFSGKKLQQGDIVNYTAASKEIQDYKKANGKYLYWTDALFGGMPSYQVSNSVIPGRSIRKGERLLSLFNKRPIGYFLLMMVTYYILLVTLGISPWLSLIGSIAFSFSTYHIVLLEAGHSNKIRALAFIPLIIAGLLQLLQQRRLLLGGTLFTFGLALNLSANHIQMTYYFMLCALILAGIYLVKYIKERAFRDLGITAGVALAGVLLAMAPSLANLWSSYEYGEETMRGKPVLEAPKTTSSSSSSAVDGLAWDYAMQWSHAGRDLWTLLAPRAVGGSNGERVKSGQLHEQYRLAGYPADKDGAQAIGNLYWGGLPFTSGPAYYGAIILFLFVLGSILVKGPVKWWLVSAVILTLLISLGKNLGWIQRLLFDYFPLYNKWRSPNSIVAVTAVFLPLLGALGLDGILKGNYTKGEGLRALYIATGLTGGLALLMGLLGNTFFSFLNASETGLQPQIQQVFINDRSAFSRMDFLRSAGLILASAGLLWAYLNNQLRKHLLFIGLGILVVGDLFSVARRYIKPSDFVAPRVVNQVFEPRPVDQQILAKESSRGDYRVFDVSVDPFNSSLPSYFHNTIGGYSAVKLQRYQDMIDRYISQNHKPVLDMLNTKYTITENQELIENPGALGPVWLVENIEIVSTPEEEISALDNLAPGATAVVLDKEFGNYVGDFDPQKSGTIRRTVYDPQNLVYEFSSETEQFAVFSEVWYPPSKGWKAYIDGVEVPFIRVNYILRGMRIPAGQHEIRFAFRPTSIYLGGAISRFSGWLILWGFLLIGGWNVYAYLKRTPLPEKESESDTVVPKSKSTRSQKKSDGKKGKRNK